jgi:hypothetical protein
MHHHVSVFGAIPAAAGCCLLSVVDKRSRCGRRGPPDRLPGHAAHRGPHRPGRRPADGRSPGTESTAQPARSRELVGHPPAPGLVAHEAVTASVMGVRRFPLASQGLDADAGVGRADDALGDPPHLDQARLIPIFDTPHNDLPVRPPRPLVAAAHRGRQRRSAPTRHDAEAHITVTIMMRTGGGIGSPRPGSRPLRGRRRTRRARLRAPGACANPSGWSGPHPATATEPRIPRSVSVGHLALTGANLIIRFWATGHHCGHRIGLRRTAGFASGARWWGDSHPAAAPPHRSGHNAIFNNGGGHLRVGEYRCLRCCAGWGTSAGGRRGTIRRSVASRRLAAVLSGGRARR